MDRFMQLHNNSLSLAAHVTLWSPALRGRGACTEYEAQEHTSSQIPEHRSGNYVPVGRDEYDTIPPSLHQRTVDIPVSCVGDMVPERP
jgi:hypothetical protein